MTSRARKIVLAMYGHQRPVAVRLELTDYPAVYTAHCCYDAMDEPDEPRIVLGGNYGMPVA